MSGKGVSVPKSEAPAAKSWGAYLKDSLSELFFGSKLNILLLALPVAVVSDAAGWSGTVTFITALLALCPLAERIGFATEQMALHTNATVGGLLNATFGNVTEMIVSLFAIRRGLLRVVQLSLLGSVLSNLLLVLGCSFLLGGLRYKEQFFSSDTVRANTSLLMLGMITLLMPAMLDATNTQLHEKDALHLSRFCSVILLVVYVCFLIFQLKTHSYLFDGPAAPLADKDSSTRQELNRAPSEGDLKQAEEDPEEKEEEEEEEEEDFLGFKGSIFWMGVITLLIALLSDYIVDTIEGAASTLNLPVAFVSTILLPIVGNAAEHAAAVMFAMKNKMELSIGVAVGSATQITLLAIPFCVVAAWLVGSPLSLDFAPFETIGFTFTVIGTTSIMSDGKSNWLKGLVLCAAYVVLAAAFFFHEDPPGVNGATWADKDAVEA